MLNSNYKQLLNILNEFRKQYPNDYEFGRHTREFLKNYGQKPQTIKSKMGSRKKDDLMKGIPCKGIGLFIFETGVIAKWGRYNIRNRQKDGIFTSIGKVNVIRFGVTMIRFNHSLLSPEL